MITGTVAHEKDEYNCFKLCFCQRWQWNEVPFHLVFDFSDLIVGVLDLKSYWFVEPPHFVSYKLCGILFEKSYMHNKMVQKYRHHVAQNISVVLFLIKCFLCKFLWVPQSPYGWNIQTGEAKTIRAKSQGYMESRRSVFFGYLCCKGFRAASSYQNILQMRVKLNLFKSEYVQTFRSVFHVDRILYLPVMLHLVMDLK